MIWSWRKRWRFNVFVAAIATSSAVLVAGCGPAVHNEVAERARQWFDKPHGSRHSALVAEYRGIIDRQLASLQAGVVFPDWGYGCMSMDDPAEAAHWTPFLEYGVEYFQRTYTKPYSAQAEQLIAFLFGIASHQVADEQWHSLSGLRDGFMRVLANSTFNGQFSRAHDVLDVGGDFAMAHMDELRFILDKWSVPVGDVIEIYKDMGVSLARWRLNICVTRQFYAMEAVKRFGQGLFSSYASKAPMLTERIDDYYNGGLFSMAASTADCWRSLVDWFEHGEFSQKCLVSDYAHGNRSSWRSPAEAILDAMWPRDTWMRSANASMATMALATEHEGSLVVSAGDLQFPALPDAPSTGSDSGRNSRSAAQHVFAAHRKPGSAAHAADTCADLSTAFTGIKQLYTTDPYSGFGTAVATGDFNGDGRADLAISAPFYTRGGTGIGAGAVFVVHEADVMHSFSQQNILHADPLVLTPEPHANTTSYPQFGASLAVVDFNADGIDDLAIGSSAYGHSPTGAHLGRVDIYLGHAGSGLSTVPDFSLTAAQLSRYTDSPFAYQRIGGFLFGEDVDNDGHVDLLIGAPYTADVPYEMHAGRVFGYLSRPRTEASAGRMGAPDISLASPQRQSFEWFGFSAKSVHVKETNTTLLLVGAPGHKRADPEGSDDHVLAGAVYAFSVRADTPKTPPVFEGTRFAALKDRTQLGSQIHVWQTPETLLVIFGSPSEHSSSGTGFAAGSRTKVLGPSPPDRGWQAGEVRIVDPSQWKHIEHEGNGGADDVAGLLNTLHGLQSPGHFGRALAATEDDLWIGEPFSGIEDGRIYRWRSGLSQPECFGVPSGMMRARFGHRILAAKDMDGSAELLVVTAPHDSQFSRLGGTVLLLRRK
ncbi:hypothetical protein H4R99_005418 [Coemansia sp. RSA 1722]|nr:hypothetical protein H4R99_005418 [Coemansia sp. RSA 1722]